MSIDQDKLGELLGTFVTDLGATIALDADGTWRIVEPLASDTLAGNLNPVGRVYYSFSTFLCVPNARSQPGEAAIRRVAGQAGFTRFRRATETPFNVIYEARP
jgi:hypothetical protein